MWAQLSSTSSNVLSAWTQSPFEAMIMSPLHPKMRRHPDLNWRLICSRMLYHWAIPPDNVPRPHLGDTISQLVVGLISATCLNSTWRRQFGPAGFRGVGRKFNSSCQPVSALQKKPLKHFSVFSCSWPCADKSVYMIKNKTFLIKINKTLLLLIQIWCHDKNKTLQLIQRNAEDFSHKIYLSGSLLQWDS